MSVSSELIKPDDQSHELVPQRGIDSLLAKIRPDWQAKELIVRVKKLLPVDTSSACQKLLNAAIWDLREKIVRAGIDIATESASLNKLPPVKRVEDILEGYSTFNILELSYRMGLLDRSDWKRLQRAYDIRRDLEHEDNEYVAQIEDVVYIFRSAIEIVLARDPMELLRVDDAKELIEAPVNVSPSQDFIRDHAKAPDPRQIEILQYLVNSSLDSKVADVIRQNAIEALRVLQAVTNNTVKIQLGREFQDRAKRKLLTMAEAKVTFAAGFLPYLKLRQIEAFFEDFYKKLEQIGHAWDQHTKHGEILDDLEDIGGLLVCPEGSRKKILLWMTLCYMGEPGGYGYYGWNRKVFFSNVAAPRIIRMIQAANSIVVTELAELRKDPHVKLASTNTDVAARFDQLLALTSF